MDNLESGTYEVFEKDPVKYREYQNAIHLALMDKNDTKNDILVMVLGAGRGPLVRATLRVSITSTECKRNDFHLTKNFINVFHL